MAEQELFALHDQKMAHSTRHIEPQSPTTLYHIYHSGPNAASYSIHTTSDSNTILVDLPNVFAATPAFPISDTKSLGISEKSLSTPENPSTKPKLSLSERIKRAKAYDNPKYDPRTQTAPYYLSTPILHGHCPPSCLRLGGTRDAPTTCLLHPNSGWRNWKLQFGDILAQEGVVDGRGVVSLDYGTKKGENGTLKGYPLRKRRWPGETGKAWFQRNKTLGRTDADWVGEKAKPEEVVDLSWMSPLSTHAREYQFTWRGFNFVWKGTNDNFWRKNAWDTVLRFCHLKLVVVIPYGEGQSKEVLLARYSSALSGRKSGRLEIFDHAVDDFLSNNIIGPRQIHAPPIGFEDLSLLEKSPRFPQLDSEIEDAAKTRRRFRDLVVSTAMSMIKGEYSKRQIIITIILTLSTAYN